MLQVKEYIALLIEQAENDPTRLKKDQIKVSIRLVMTKDAHVPDTLTKIRALSGVTVVGQKEPVFRNICKVSSDCIRHLWKPQICFKVNKSNSRSKNS